MLTVLISRGPYISDTQRETEVKISVCKSLLHLVLDLAHASLLISECKE